MKPHHHCSFYFPFSLYKLCTGHFVRLGTVLNINLLDAKSHYLPILIMLSATFLHNKNVTRILLLLNQIFVPFLSHQMSLCSQISNALTVIMHPPLSVVLCRYSPYSAYSYCTTGHHHSTGHCHHRYYVRVSTSVCVCVSPAACL